MNYKKKLILIALLFTDSRIPFPIQIFLSQLDLNLTGTPRFIEPRLERTIEAEENVPSFSWNRLHPVVLFTNRSLRPEIDVNRAIGINYDILILAADSWPFLVSLEH